MKIDLGQTVNTLANVGVIAGIVFLGYELRQNTVATRMMAAESHLTAANRPNELVVENREFAELIAGANAGDELSPVDVMQLNSLYAIRMRGWQSAFLQYESGTLDEELLRGYDQTVKDLVSGNDLFREFWQESTDRYSHGFVDHVQSVLGFQSRE
jgi:hypothetical protein